MSKFTLLPIIVFSVTALFGWAMVWHMGMANRQRAAMAASPRSRPYGTKLPESLIRHKTHRSGF